MKLRRDYFVPGSHHVCMFCETPIAKLIDGKLHSLASKAHLLFPKTLGGCFIVNCCANCASTVDTRDPVMRKAIYHNVIFAMEDMDTRNGKSVSLRKRRARLSDVPKAKAVVELDIKNRKESLTRLGMK